MADTPDNGWPKTMGELKPIYWCGSSYKDLLDFPGDARQDAGYQLHRVQTGEMPRDFKPMSSVGSGVYEIRISETRGAFRVF